MPLMALTRNTSEWKAGPLPEDALKAFKDMKNAHEIAVSTARSYGTLQF